MTILSRLTDKALRGALERAADKEPFIIIEQEGAGFVRASTACGGTCPAHEFLAGRHDVTIHWDSRAQCDCGFRQGLCWHIASVLTERGGQLPDPPSADTIARLLAAGQAILAEQGDPASSLGRIRQNYAALVAQFAYLAKDREAQPGHQCAADGCGLSFITARGAADHARMMHAGVGDFTGQHAPDTQQIAEVTW